MPNVQAAAAARDGGAPARRSGPSPEGCAARKSAAFPGTLFGVRRGRALFDQAPPIHFDPESCRMAQPAHRLPTCTRLMIGGPHALRPPTRAGMRRGRLAARRAAAPAKGPAS